MMSIGYVTSMKRQGIHAEFWRGMLPKTQEGDGRITFK
jgi:hypothetical protein